MLAKLDRINFSDLRSAYDILDDIFILGIDEEGNTMYDMEVVNRICEYVYEGADENVIAKNLQVDVLTLRKFLQSHRKIASMINYSSWEAERKFIGYLDQQAAEGNVAAAKFFLMNRGTNWSDKPNMVMNMEDDSPVLNITLSE